MTRNEVLDNLQSKILACNVWTSCTEMYDHVGLRVRIF